MAAVRPPARLPRPLLALTVAALCVAATLPHAAFAQTLIDEDDSVPRPIDPSVTLPPPPPSTIVASTAGPDPTPVATPPVSVPLFPTKPGPSQIRSVVCSEITPSEYGAASCPAENRAGNLRMRNVGSIPFEVFYVRPNGNLNLKQTIDPGQTEVVSFSVCLGDRYVVHDLCDECMFAVEVTGTQAETVDVSNSASEESCGGGGDGGSGPVSGMFEGTWDPLVTWLDNLIPAAMVNIPGSNRVMGISAVQETRFRTPAGRSITYTQAALYNPDDGSFVERDLDGHDIFCAGFTLLPDGKLLTVGGGQDENSFKVSTYNPFTGTWSRHVDTQLGHWYGTAVVTRDDEVMIALGTDQTDTRWRDESDFPEKSNGLNFDLPWSNMSGIDLSGKGPDRTHWYPVMHLMSNGDILESGTQNEMFRIRSASQGRIFAAGSRNTARTEQEAWGAYTIMYDQNKLLTVGGIENWNQDGQPDTSVYQRAISIDMTNPFNIRTTRVSDLAYPRAFPNLVVLPSGQVLAIGGKNNVYQWDDTASVYNAELWDPETGDWTLLAAQDKPRNYHSSAILLKDGRVLSGGGGLCGNCRGVPLNQPNSQIFNPPYLFDASGVLKERPIIVNSPATLGANQRISVVVRGANFGEIQRVSIVKQASVTHSITTDARQMELPIIRTTVRNNRAVYRVQGLSNLNIMTPGYWFLFVLDQTGTPSVAAEIKVVR